MRPVLLLLALCLPAGAAETGAQILSRPVGARASAMGRAFTAVPGGADGLLYNPALPGFSGASFLSLSWMNGYGGGGYGFAALPFKAGAFTVTPAYLHYDSGEMELNLSGGGAAGSVTAESDHVPMLSAAWRASPALSLGASVKAVSTELAEAASARSVHYDAGAVWRPAPRLFLGAAALNNGGRIKFETESAPPPSAFRAGAAYSLELDPEMFDSMSGIAASDLVLAADWSRARGEEGYVQAGCELNLDMTGSGILLSVRGGWLFGRDDEGLTLGFGVRRDGWDFSVGYEASRDLDTRLPVTLSWFF